MKFVATKKGITTNFFSPLSFVAVFGLGIRDLGWVKIRIRDPGTATLDTTQLIATIGVPRQFRMRKFRLSKLFNFQAF